MVHAPFRLPSSLSALPGYARAVHCPQAAERQCSTRGAVALRCAAARRGADALARADERWAANINNSNNTDTSQAYLPFYISKFDTDKPLPDEP
eukprot:1019963-Pleurochrysis_carterae.AAC.3